MQPIDMQLASQLLLIFSLIGNAILVGYKVFGKKEHREIGPQPFIISKSDPPVLRSYHTATQAENDRRLTSLERRSRESEDEMRKELSELHEKVNDGFLNVMRALGRLEGKGL